MGDTVRTVVAQVEPWWEHIVVDDGAADGMANLLRDMPTVVSDIRGALTKAGLRVTRSR